MNTNLNKQASLPYSAQAKAGLKVTLGTFVALSLTACGGTSVRAVTPPADTASSMSSLISVSSVVSSEPSSSVSSGGFASSSSFTSSSSSLTSSSGFTSESSASSSSVIRTDAKSILGSTGTFFLGEESFNPFIFASDSDAASPANATVSFANEEAHFAINVTTDEIWHVQLTHNTSITADTQYTLCFDARVDAPRSILVGIGADSDGIPGMMGTAFNGHTTISTAPIDVNTEYKTYKLTFEGTVTDPTSRVLFNLGTHSNDVYLDNIGLFEGPDCGTLVEAFPGSGNGSSNSSVASSGPITARQAVSEMGMGINLGNTFDSNFGDRNAPSNETAVRPNLLMLDDVEAIVAEGFGHVRIPATWDPFADLQAPYTIQSVRLNRYEQVVDWALERGLYVIINMHHEAWFKFGYNDPNNRARFVAIWEQLIARFSDKSPSLIFEILNEPGGNETGLTFDQIDTVNREILALIRSTQPTRLVVYAGNGFSGIERLEAATIPAAGDQYLFANYHNYDPFQFGILCERPWILAQDRDELEAIYQRAALYGLNNDVPIMMNEFGVPFLNFAKPQDRCEQSQRLDYLKAHAELSKQYGIVPTVWDDGGSFRLFNRADNSWDDSIDLMLDAFGRKNQQFCGL